MSRYLIDTNVLSELRKGDQANPGVRHWFEQNLAAEMWLSVLVVGELRRGVELISRRDPAAAELLRGWLRSITDEYRDRVLDIDLDVAMAWAQLGVPDPVPVVDGLLAATALTHDLILVTRNISDVTATGAQMLNPFD